MNVGAYILTGLKTYRQGAHSPHILDWNRQNIWFGPDHLEEVFANYEHFRVLPVTIDVIHQLSDTVFGGHGCQPCIDDFSIWRDERTPSSLILCTSRDFLKAKAFRSARSTLTRWRHAMENFVLLLVVLVCLASELIVQTVAAHPINNQPLHASDFIFDADAPQQEAPGFVYDPEAPTLKGSRFVAAP